MTRTWMQRQRGRGVVALGVAGLLATAWAIASPSPALGTSTGYDFSDIRVEQVDGSHTRVVYDYAWTTDEFPGWRTCTWTVYDAEGNAIGAVTNDLMGLDTSYSNKEKLVTVAGSGASADVSCEPGSSSSDDGYSASDVRAVRRGNDARMVTVLFNSAWRGSDRPGAATCTATVRDREGNVLTTQEFDFATAQARHTNASHSWLADDPLPVRPMTADLECRPYGT